VTERPTHTSGYTASVGNGLLWWQTEDQGALVDELRRQLASLRDQLTTSQRRSSTLEAELGQRDRQLVRKCDALQLTETQVGRFCISCFGEGEQQQCDSW